MDGISPVRFSFPLKQGLQRVSIYLLHEFSFIFFDLHKPYDMHFVMSIFQYLGKGYEVTMVLYSDSRKCCFLVIC